MFFSRRRNSAGEISALSGFFVVVVGGTMRYLSFMLLLPAHYQFETRTNPRMKPQITLMHTAQPLPINRSVFRSVSICEICGSVSLGCEVECFNHASEGDLSRLIHFFNNIRISSFKEAHAMRFTGHESRADVANVFTFSGEFLACFYCCLLGGSELVHLDSRKIAFNH